MHGASSASRVSVIMVLILLGAACSSSGKPEASEPTTTTRTVPLRTKWAAPADPLVRAKAAGLVPDTEERFMHHVHAHLDVFVNGKRVTVPAAIGINIQDPGVHVFDYKGTKAYGGIRPPCGSPCISPLHTHDESGVIHTESPTKVDNTLGQLFVEWGVRLDTKCVDRACAPDTKIAFYVDGKPFTGDPRNIALADRRQIAVVIGTPPATIPSKGDFSAL